MPLQPDAFNAACVTLRQRPKRWLVTGAAGFIGSNLVERLLLLGQTVVALDRYSPRGRNTLADVQAALSHHPESILQNLHILQGDIRDQTLCQTACRGVDYVLHHAMAGDLPKTIQSGTSIAAINGADFLGIMGAAAMAGVKTLVYASSCAVYGNSGDSPNQENQPVQPQSPYAMAKVLNEFQTRLLSEKLGLPTVGFRYFNVYGVRQYSSSVYAAVIPKWIESMQSGRAIKIYGDGSTIRDFCHIDDVFQANILAATTPKQPPDTPRDYSRIYNIASGQPVTLLELFHILQKQLSPQAQPVFEPITPQDIHVSKADITKAETELGFRSQVSLDDGLKGLLNSITHQQSPPVTLP